MTAARRRHDLRGGWLLVQDPLRFNDTVRNNIAYGWADASLAGVKAVARAARAHEFIQRLPEKYDACVGERGNRLSVGERQRITIARALIKNPRIISSTKPRRRSTGEAADARADSECGRARLNHRRPIEPRRKHDAAGLLGEWWT